MRTRRRIELSVTELIGLIQQENLGEPHAIFAGGERYTSPRFRQAAAADNEIRDKLALIQHARSEYYGWITHGEDWSAVLVAAIGRAAVVLTRTGDHVRIIGADPERLVEALVHRLPEVPAGRGESISFRASSRTQEALRLDTLLRAPRLGGAQLYVARRDSTGIRHRADDWITVLDLAGHGRWAVYATAGRDGRFVNAVPATPQWLAAKLSELHRSLA